MRFAFIDAEKAHFPVDTLCRVLEVSRSGYYAWRLRSRSRRRAEDARLAVQIAGAHRRSRRTYGSPRVHAELRTQGVAVSRKRVARLMREQGLCGVTPRRFVCTTDARHDEPIAPNLLDRQFEVQAPNVAWVGDVTCVATGEGWLFLAVLIDLFSRRVVGWATSATNDRALALAALDRAASARRPRRGLLHHTDRGSPYASGDYRARLAHYGMAASMSRTGNCWDNAVAESFFGTLKTELTDPTRYATHAAAHAAIGDYVENFYNLQRRHSHNGCVSPIEYEVRSLAAGLAA